MRIKQSLFRFSFIIPILFAMMFVLVCSCDEQPTGVIDVSEGDGLSGRGDIDPGAGGSFLLGSVSDSTFAPGHIEVWAQHLLGVYEIKEPFGDMAGVSVEDSEPFQPFYGEKALQ